jgi:hypothetical protein
MQRAPLVGRLVCRDCDFRAVAVEQVSNLGNDVRSKTVIEDQQSMLRDGHGGAAAASVAWALAACSTAHVACRARVYPERLMRQSRKSLRHHLHLSSPANLPTLSSAMHGYAIAAQHLRLGQWMIPRTATQACTHRNHRAPSRLDGLPCQKPENFSLSVTLPPNDGSCSKASLRMTSPPAALSHTVASAPGVFSTRSSVAGRR